MVTILPPKTSLGSAIGKAGGEGYTEGANRAFDRSQLQQAFARAQNSIEQMTQSGEYDPSKLYFAIAEAGAGIPGWSQTVSEGFPVLSQQIQRKILLQQGKGNQPDQGRQEGQQPTSPSASQDISQQQFSVTGKPTTGRDQQRPSPVQQLPSNQPIVEGQAGVSSLQPQSLAQQGAQIYNQNLAAGMNPTEAMNNAIQQTGLTQQDIQNQITTAKTTQELAAGERTLSKSFKDLGESELKSLYPAVEKDPQASNEFWQISEKYKDLPDATRIARTLDEWRPWYDAKVSIDKVMTPSFFQRLMGEGPRVLNGIKGPVQNFAKRGIREQQYSLKHLMENGLSLPESYEMVYPTQGKAKNYVDKTPDFPQDTINPVFGGKAFERRSAYLEKQGKMVEDLAEKLPEILSDSDSLMSLLYQFMQKGWRQSDFSQAVDIAKRKGLKLNARQNSEFDQLGQDMSPGFWDIMKMPGVF